MNCCAAVLLVVRNVVADVACLLGGTSVHDWGAVVQVLVGSCVGCHGPELILCYRGMWVARC